MGFFDGFVDKEKTSKLTFNNPKEYLNTVLRSISGSSVVRETKFDIFYQIVAFKGVVDGVGTSTIVANTALALADIGLTVLVVDTSILQPVQDILLKTGEKEKDKEHLDWFDLPYTKLSVLHESKLSSKISVLSFYSKNRNITDILSTNDSSELVDMAFTEFHNKFDIILVDCCHELTNINTTALQMSQKVIQVWNDSPTVVSNLDNFISNCVTLCCPLDKMRFVIYSKDNPDVIGGLDELLKQYRLKKITQSFISRDVHRVLCEGKPVWGYETNEKDIVAYNVNIIDIVKHILSLDVDRSATGTITANDIMDGKVDGTLSKSYADQPGVEVATTLDQADAMLSGRKLTREEKKQAKLAKKNAKQNATVEVFNEPIGDVFDFSDNFSEGDNE